MINERCHPLISWENLSLLDTRMWHRKGVWQPLFDSFDYSFIPGLHPVIDPCVPGRLQRSHPSPWGTGHFLLRAPHKPPRNYWFRLIDWFPVHWCAQQTMIVPPQPPSSAPGWFHRGFSLDLLLTGPQWLHSSCLIFPGENSPLETFAKCSSASADAPAPLW